MVVCICKTLTCTYEETINYLFPIIFDMIIPYARNKSCADAYNITTDYY